MAGSSRFFLLAILVLVAGTAVGAGTATSAASGPAAVVTQASSEIVNALNKNETKLKKDPGLAEELVKKYLLPHFDFDFTSQLVLGRYWRTATPEQREEFEDAFVHFLVAAYANGLKNYHGADIKVFPFRGNASQPYVKVRTQIATPDHQPIEVDYALKKTANGWRAFDVIIDGISYVTTYQNEFQAEIQRTSLKALIKRLQNAQPPSSLTAATGKASQ